MNHCYYCNRPLYKMSWNASRKEAVKTVNNEHYHNSDMEEICVLCDHNLMRRGTQIEHDCGNVVYVLKRDMIRPFTLKNTDLAGVEPQADPIDGVYNRCVHCNGTIEWG